jgi:hypothetical protein
MIFTKKRKILQKMFTAAKGVKKLQADRLRLAGEKPEK